MHQKEKIKISIKEYFSESDKPYENLRLSDSVIDLSEKNSESSLILDLFKSDEKDALCISCYENYKNQSEIFIFMPTKAFEMSDLLREKFDELKTFTFYHMVECEKKTFLRKGISKGALRGLSFKQSFKSEINYPQIIFSVSLPQFEILKEEIILDNLALFLKNYFKSLKDHPDIDEILFYRESFLELIVKVSSTPPNTGPRQMLSALKEILYSQLSFLN